VVELHPVAAVPELRVVLHDAGRRVHDAGGRARQPAGAPSGHRRSSTRVASPIKRSSSSRRASRAAALAASSGVAHAGRPSTRRAPPRHVVSGDRDPAVVARARVNAVRRFAPRWLPVRPAPRRWRCTADGRAEERDRRIGLRDVDVLAFTAAPTVPQRRSP